MGYLMRVLERLVTTPSPTGYTDQIVRLLCAELDAIGVSYELTRRGAIRATLPGRVSSPDRAAIAHIDTLGAMVKNLKPNGRLEVVPIGHWSARFAEGGRVTIFTDSGTRRGTVLPLKASGHTYNEEIDTQPVGWTNVEVRVDEFVHDDDGLRSLGLQIGDFVAFDTGYEVTPSGYINSRHLDDKAGVACLITAAKAIVDTGVELPIDCHLLVTISEEVGSGASAVLHGDVSEMVAVDNGTPAPGQNSRELGVTVAMADSTGPFDYHLTHALLGLCVEHGIHHQRDVFRYYRCDAASAIEAGNDIRHALVCFGVDASHGYERTHMHSLQAVSELLSLYMQADPVVKRDEREMGPIEGFPSQPFNPAAPAAPPDVPNLDGSSSIVPPAETHH